MESDRVRGWLCLLSKWWSDSSLLCVVWADHLWTRLGLPRPERDWPWAGSIFPLQCFGLALAILSYDVITLTIVATNSGHQEPTICDNRFVWCWWVIPHYTDDVMLTVVIMLNFFTFPIMKKKQIRDSSLNRKVLLKHCRVSESVIKKENN